MESASTHVSPAFTSSMTSRWIPATTMVVLMTVAAAWLKVDTYDTGYGCAHQVSPPTPLVELDTEVADRPGRVLGSAPDQKVIRGPAWSEQVRDIPLRTHMTEYRAGAREPRDYLISASPFSCFVLTFHGLDRWLKCVIVLIGCWMSDTRGCGCCELLQGSSPLARVMSERPPQRPYPLARVMSPTHMFLPVAEDRFDMALPFMWLMNLMQMVILFVDYGTMQSRCFVTCRGECRTPDRMNPFEDVFVYNKNRVLYPALVKVGLMPTLLSEICIPVTRGGHSSRRRLHFSGSTRA